MYAGPKKYNIGEVFVLGYMFLDKRLQTIPFKRNSFKITEMQKKKK